MIWTLHDMTPLSGGVGYREEGGLPVEPFGPIRLNGSGAILSERLLGRRTAAFKNSRLTAGLRKKHAEARFLKRIQ